MATIKLVGGALIILAIMAVVYCLVVWFFALTVDEE